MVILKRKAITIPRLAVVLGLVASVVLMALPVSAADPFEGPKKVSPELQTKDPVVINAITKAGSDVEYVELYRDYTAQQPFSRQYRDKKSDNAFLVISQLPMVTPAGERIDPSWFYLAGNYRSRVNTFSAVVTEGRIEVVDTATGKSVLWQPQVFLNGKEVLPFSKTAMLLDVDPMNENYNQNVLEWDYGICERRVRLIEGKLLERWIFNKDPRGEVRIKHNHTGDLKLRLGRFQINDDEELVPREAFINPLDGYPVEIGASPETYYTSANDGDIGASNANWDTCHDAAIGTVDDADTKIIVRTLFEAGVYYIYRGFLIFDTSALPDACTVTAAVLSLWGNGTAENEADAGDADFAIVEGVQDDPLQTNDFGDHLLKTTLGCPYFDQATWDENGENQLTLNATGRGWVNKTGTTKFCLRNRGDIDDNVPTGVNRIRMYSQDQGGGTIPMLVVTYTMPSLTVTTQSATDIVNPDATLNGSITVTGDGDCTKRGFVWDTTSRANPGNVAPPATYANSWTETGSFGVGSFSHEITGLAELTTYYFRSCAYSPTPDTWGYGDEREFFVGEEGKIYLEIRPDLDETRIRGNAGIPADYQTGNWNGYTMPIWGQDDEELYFLICVPERWDGESNPIIHIKWSTEGNELGNVCMWEVAWEHATPNVPETLPLGAATLITSSRTVDSAVLNAFYQDYYVVDYDIIPEDAIEANDIITFRIRHFGANDTLANDAALFAVGVDFARGDLLGDPEGGVAEIVDDLIDDGTLIGGVDLIYLFLSLLALGLTVAMFATRNSMLGFPCLIFWAILGGYAYTQSTVTWDWQYFLFFASIFMGVFCAFAAYALRTKKEEAREGDLFFDEGGDKDVKFIDEGAPPSESRGRYDEYGNSRRKPKPEPAELLSPRVRAVRERAATRRRRFDSY